MYKNTVLILTAMVIFVDSNERKYTCSIKKISSIYHIKHKNYYSNLYMHLTFYI